MGGSEHFSTTFLLLLRETEMATKEEMQESHDIARREHTEWLRDISHWRVDHRRAMALIAQVQQQLWEADSELEAHSAAIREHHLEMLSHGRLMDHDVESESVERVHNELEAMHEDVRKRHAALEKQHNELIGDLAKLFEALAYED